jgi:hypothetical protein
MRTWLVPFAVSWEVGGENVAVYFASAFVNLKFVMLPGKYSPRPRPVEL